MAKILLVEDDTNLSEIYQARMEAEGYTVVSASDGESALAIAAKERPDLIISDVMMPKISGFEMLDILRNTAGLKDTPVIMLTALGQADDKSRADELGANRYLVKSQVTLEDIVNAAHALLEDGDAPLPPAVATTPAADPANPTPADPAPTGPLTSTGAAEPTSTRSHVADYERRPVVPVHVPPPEITADRDPEPESESEPATDREAAPALEPETEEVLETEEAESAPEVENDADETGEAIDEADDVPAKPAEELEHGPAPLSTAMIDEKIVAGTVDKLLQKTAKPAPASESEDDEPAHGRILPGSSDAGASNADRTAKKVISPIPKTPAPSLDELLAKEVASGHVDNVITEASDQDSQPADGKDGKKPTIDPNSIAL